MKNATQTTIEKYAPAFEEGMTKVREAGSDLSKRFDALKAIAADLDIPLQKACQFYGRMIKFDHAPQAA